MNKIVSWFTKKRILVTSLLLSILIYPAMYIADKSSSFMVEHIYETITYLLLIFVPIFVVSILILFLKESVFISWKKFTFIYLFIYLSLVIFSPLRCDYIPICKETMFMFFVPTYLVISIFLIIFKSIKKQS